MAEQLTHPNPKEVMARVEEFVRANLAECARELIIWDRTSLLPDGKVRQAAVIAYEMGVGDQLSIARRIVEKQALELAAGELATRTAEGS